MLAWIVPPPQTPEKHYPRCNQICQAGRKKGWNVSCHVKTIWKCKSYVMNILIHVACEYWTILCSIFHPPFTTNTLKIHIFGIQKKDIYWNWCVLAYITVWFQLINTICDNRLAPNPLAELPLLWNLLHLSTTYLHGLHPPPPHRDGRLQDRQTHSERLTSAESVGGEVVLVGPSKKECLLQRILLVGLRSQLSGVHRAEQTPSGQLECSWAVGVVGLMRPPTLRGGGG